MHVVTREHWAIAGLENALLAMAVIVQVARCLVPVGVRRVLGWGQLHFFFCNQRV